MGKERVTVPVVIDKTEAEATQLLTAAGLGLTIERVDHETIPAGKVIDQTPKGGVRVDKGSKVKLVVSNGPPKVRVPDILCKTRRQAADIVAAAGLRLQFEGTYARVVDQSPRANDVVAKGSTVVGYTAPGTSCR